jgi:NAD(P)-dependent dehydrogenase (short-subunit alcohol dehydrogenase family)
VTGGTRGIRRGIVEMVAAEGAAVGFTGRSDADGHAVEEAVCAGGGRAGLTFDQLTAS